MKTIKMQTNSIPIQNGRKKSSKQLKKQMKKKNVKINRNKIR